MKNMRVNSLIFVCIFLLYACQKSSLKPSDYIKWVEDEKNGLKKTKVVSSFKATAQYQPKSYIVAKEEHTDDLSKSVFDKRIEELGQMEYFKLELSVESANTKTNITNYNVNDENAFEQRLQYLSFGMRRDIVLVVGLDTFPCLLYHFERSYDLRPSRNFLLAFDAADKKTDKTLIINALEFGIGLIKIQFENTTIQNIPNIITNP